MRSTEGARGAKVIIERAPSPPGDTDPLGLAAKLSTQGKAYFSGQAIDQKITGGIAGVQGRVNDLIKARQEEIPLPNSTAKTTNADAMKHALLNSWMIRGLAPEHYYINNPAVWERIQSDVLTVTDAHEYSGYAGVFGGGFQPRPDQVMDLINNRIARQAPVLIPNTMPASTKALGELTDDELFYPNLYMLIGPNFNPSNRSLPSRGGFVVVDEAADPKGSRPTSGLLVPTPLKPWVIKKIKR